MSEIMQQFARENYIYNILVYRAHILIFQYLYARDDIKYLAVRNKRFPIFYYVCCMYIAITFEISTVFKKENYEVYILYMK